MFNNNSNRRVRFCVCVCVCVCVCELREKLPEGLTTISIMKRLKVVYYFYAVRMFEVFQKLSLYLRWRIEKNNVLRCLMHIYYFTSWIFFFELNQYMYSRDSGHK